MLNEIKYIWKWSLELNHVLKRNKVIWCVERIAVFGYGGIVGKRNLLFDGHKGYMTCNNVLSGNVTLQFEFTIFLNVYNSISFLIVYLLAYCCTD